HHAAVPRVEQSHDPLDHATLAGRVAALEQDHDAQAAISNPFFELHELDLQAPELLVVLLARERSFLLFLGRHAADLSLERPPPAALPPRRGRGPAAGSGRW